MADGLDEQPELAEAESDIEEDVVNELEHADLEQSEIVLGLVGPAGAQLGRVSVFLKNKLQDCGYKVREIRVSNEVIPLVINTAHIPEEDGYERTNKLMNAGNEARLLADNDAILALGAATRIHRSRETDEAGNPIPRLKTAYIVRSLKRPEEVVRLREIYGPGFYLIATYASYQQRLDYLVTYSHIPQAQAIELINRDADEHTEHGQQVTERFSLLISSYESTPMMLCVVRLIA